MTVDIAANLEKIRLAIKAAESRYGRPAHAVSLLAVSKGQAAADIALAYRHGQGAFAESYLQEAMDKMARLSDLAIEWHFIGPIQSNKAKRIAALFSWVHSLDRQLIARRLSRYRPEGLPWLNVCVQLKVTDKTTQAGVTVDQLEDLLQCVHSAPRLKLRGLMVIAPRYNNFARQRAEFARIGEIYERFRVHYSLDTLSMGMSNDFVAAIAEQANIVRLGRILFGQRA